MIEDQDLMVEGETILAVEVELEALDLVVTPFGAKHANEFPITNGHNLSPLSLHHNSNWKLLG